MQKSRGDTSSVPIRLPEPSVIALRELDGRHHFELPLEPRRWSLGSRGHCDLLVDDPFVSRVHCTLVREPDGALMLHDHGSKNGTLVDGTPAFAARLVPGARVLVGQTHLIAVGEADAAGARAMIKGRSPALHAAVETARRAARSEASILIVGETGTGKELIARLVHEESRRARGPFVAINCGAFSREMLAGELFGHRRGSFTGAHADRSGVFQQADGGTLFLDEVAEMPLELQAHLLRAIETKRVRPIGGEERSVDVRFVAATNQLDHARLRVDVYHRLAAVEIELPPLRDRRADIVELARGFIAELAPRHGYRELLPSAIDALLAHPWRGNVRELRQTIVRAVTLGGSRIAAADLYLERMADAIPEPIADTEVSPRDSVVRTLYGDALRKHGSIRAAASVLGVPKSTLAAHAKRMGLISPRKRRRG
jgi:transcriptional regulator with PAS, ATPase and Fis domain